MIFISASLISLFLLFTIYLYSKMSKGFCNLQKMIKNIGNGNFDVNGQTSDSFRGKGEISALGKSLMEMARKLKLAAEMENELKKKMMISANMTSLLSMSQKIGHEINNNLHLITGHAFFLIKQSGQEVIDAKRIDHSAKIINESTQKVGKIVKGLRLLGKTDTTGPLRKINLKEIIEDSLSLCRHILHELNIQLDSSNIPESVTLEAHPAQMGQVLLNLIGNSCDAIKVFEDKWIRLEVKDHHEEVVINFTDCGPGIPKEIQHKFMEPFFTTKDQGKGLGLSIISSIVKSHQGKFYFVNDSPHTSFVITLPKTQETKSSGPAR